MTDRPAAGLTCRERDEAHRTARRADPVDDSPLPQLLDLGDEADPPRADRDLTTLCPGGDGRGRCLTTEPLVAEYVIAHAPEMRVEHESAAGWILSFHGAFLAVLREAFGWGDFQDAALDV